MKNSRTIQLISLAMIVAGTISLSACKKQMNNYISVIPTDVTYKAALNYKWGVNGSNYIENWKVIRKDVNFCNKDRTVIYVDYSYVNNENHDHDYTRTLLYTYNNDTGYVFSLADNKWEAYTGSFGDKWSDIYGSYSKPGSFVYEMTDCINDRDFPAEKKVENEEYIEYDFGSYNEKFRITNNPYHVLLYYNFETDESYNHKEATFHIGEVADTIEYISTITPDMIGE